MNSPVNLSDQSSIKLRSSNKKNDLKIIEEAKESLENFESDLSYNLEEFIIDDEFSNNFNKIPDSSLKNGA